MRYEKFQEWLEADPEDVIPSDILRVFGQDELADRGDADHALDPETIERLRQQMSQLRVDVITGKLDVGSEEYITRRDAIFEPLEASAKIALAIEDLLS